LGLSPAADLSQISKHAQLEYWGLETVVSWLVFASSALLP
jgi:hypothetical protein